MRRPKAVHRISGSRIAAAFRSPATNLLAARLLAARLLALALVMSPGGAFAAMPEVRAREAIILVTEIVRPDRIGYANLWDGNAYVQCRRLPDRTLRCEAAGTALQPSLKRILTPERRERLVALGWTLEPSFGNYVQVFAASRDAAHVAPVLVETLRQAYAADPDRLDVATDWIADRPCPPRNGYSQNLAGLVNDAESMRSTAIDACEFRRPADPVPPGSLDALKDRYATTLALEIARLRLNIDANVFVVFNIGIGYIQCMPDPDAQAIYCEAQSEQSWPALATLLTPERVARLHEAGYADPGRGPNYWKSYLLDRYGDGAIADEILALLCDAYNYSGATEMAVLTE